MVDAFPALATLNEQLRFGNSIEIPVSRLAKAELEFLVGLYPLAGPDMHGRSGSGVVHGAGCPVAGPRKSALSAPVGVGIQARRPGFRPSPSLLASPFPPG